jgi:hypothetical protein
MKLITKLRKELKKAKESKIQSWIDEVGRDWDRMNRFFEVAEKIGLVKDGKYIDGIPEGNEDDINEFYNLEDLLDYPHPQKIN